MGHEAAGIVEAVGNAVSGFQPGGRVTFDSTVSAASAISAFAAKSIFVMNAK
jgi:threonine dehydrogenase-like Zn-dependent dehydrogenase